MAQPTTCTHIELHTHNNQTTNNNQTRHTTTTAAPQPPGVVINTYKVIYNLIDDVKAAMEGKLRTLEEKQPLGDATVRGVCCSAIGDASRVMVR